MKVRPFERSTLWRSAFAKKKGDPDEKDRQALAQAYEQLRLRASDLIGEIHAILPNLTVHDLTHADSLWDVASEICGPDYVINPLEGFVLGASFLLHDAGLALAAYPGGLLELKNSPEYRDAVVSAWKKQGTDEPSNQDRSDPPDDIRDEAIFEVLRRRHASQAKVLATALWTQPATGRAMGLVQNEDLLESYGELIGNIAASHHWPIKEVGRFFGDPTPASAAWPRSWNVDGLALACILRCADACAIDETRAPSFLFALRRPEGTSKRHWTFQNKLYPAKRRDDGLVFESKSAFSEEKSEDWWLCFDAIAIGDEELNSSDNLLTDRKRRRMQARRIVGANNPDVLAQTVKVEGWKPVNTQPKISNPQSVIERLGGKQLYGDKPIVPIRELIQNGVDAIRARRFLDPFFAPTTDAPYPGKILVKIQHIAATDDYWVSVEDNGIGMSERVITDSLLDFGTSFWSSEVAGQLYPGLPSEGSFRPTGRFGIGFFSIFMYASEAIVASHEFKSSTDAWNVLKFSHGLRGRGKFSVELGRKQIIANSDVKTRVAFRVTRKFIQSLANPYHDATTDDDASLAPRIQSVLEELVAALDVAVGFSFLSSQEILVVEPWLYTKDLDTIWSVLMALNEKRPSYDVAVASKNQKQMLIPLEGNQQIYGYCGLNISDDECLLRSVGGLSGISDFGGPFWGAIEYRPEAARRNPGKLVAPADVLGAWIERQTTLAKTAGLTENEIQCAIRSLMALRANVRPIFRLFTSHGPLDLDDFIDTFKKERLAVFPVRGSVLDSGLPSITSSGSHYTLQSSDISFANFTIYNRAITRTLRTKLNEPNDHTLWGVIIARLRELELAYTVSLNESRMLGPYIGRDSELHAIARGDEVKSSAVELALV